MNTLDCRTLDALRSSKHLKTLLQLEPYIGHLRREIAGAFWSRVGEYLCQSISNDAITWTLTVDDQITGKDAGIRIHPDNRKADKAYSIVLLGVAWPGKQPSYIGIHRPIEGRGYRQNPDAEIELRGLLESMDYDFRGDWAVGWIDLPRLGLGNVAGGAEQTVLRLELDNQSPNDHPLAKKTAEQLAKHLKDVWRPLGRLNGSS